MKQLTIVLAGVCLFATYTLSQSFLGSIGGAVTDSTGAVVQQAKVELTDVSTGVRRSGVTNAQGLYSFPDLAPGTYTVTVSAAGF